MSLQITITPKERAAGRFVSRVRRAIQKALAEENAKHGTTQSDLARAIGVNRSVVCREIRGHKDLTLSRVAELAWALGRRAVLEIRETTTTGNHVSVTPQTASAGADQIDAIQLAPAAGSLSVEKIGIRVGA